METGHHVVPTAHFAVGSISIERDLNLYES